VQPGLVDAILQTHLEHALRAAWEGGWQPVDLFELARRRLNPAGQAFLVDTVAAEARRYAPATVDPRWQDQVHEIGAQVWWAPDRSLLEQWAERYGAQRQVCLVTAIDVGGLLACLTHLPRILPLPGTAGARRKVSRHGIDEKALARVRALLAKAEATEFPEEAETLSSKAQEMMTKFSLDRALLEADGEAAEQGSATARRLWLDAPYVSAKALLVDVVASANRCRTVSANQLGFVTVLGDEVDVELVELLCTSLLVQASRAMLAAARSGGRGAQSRSRSYRQSFLVSYAMRIGERLAQATAASQATIDSERLLPVLAARDTRVDELLSSLFPHTVERSVAVSSHTGWAAGRAAADLATLDVREALATG